jgi:hypothetical protein
VDGVAPVIRPLALGPLSADGYKILRSGVRWLCSDGHVCRPNEVIGYCNVSLERSGGRQTGPGPFAEEMEIQVGFAPRLGGRIRVATGATLGGYLDIREAKAWDPDTVIAEIEADGEASGDGAAGQLRLLMLAGRRMTALADVHSGLLPGWLGRSRAWWGAPDEVPLTLLSLGICDATSVVLGDRTAFLEMFADCPGALHVVFYPDHPVAPAAPVLLDQLQRTPAQFKALAEEVRSFMASSPVAPTADDWMFVGALLSTLGRNPLSDSYSLFTPSGSRTLPPAQAVLLSLNAEPHAILRHRQLGYRLHVMRHHQAAAGPATRAWMAQAFDVVTRSMEDVRRDYDALIDALSTASGAKVIVLNRMSTSGYEDISNYAPFDTPLSGTLANIGSKELNLILHDIAETRELYIIDVDRIAAELGGRDHLPDGIHQSGLMQAHLRLELLAILETLRRTA